MASSDSRSSTSAAQARWRAWPAATGNWKYPEVSNAKAATRSAFREAKPTLHFRTRTSPALLAERGAKKKGQFRARFRKNTSQQPLAKIAGLGKKKMNRRAKSYGMRPT